MYYKIATILAVISTMSCSNSSLVKVQSPSELRELDTLPKIKSRQLRVEMNIIESGVPVFRDKRAVTVGRKYSVSDIQNSKYAKRYYLPELADFSKEMMTKEDQVMVISITPSKGYSMRPYQIGWKAFFTPIIEDGLISLEGGVLRLSHRDSRGAFGEGTDPIAVNMQDFFGGDVLVTVSENRSDTPILTEELHPLFLRLKLGVDYRFPIDSNLILEIRVEHER